MEELPLDNPNGRDVGMGARGGELFCKSYCYFSVVIEGFGGKGDRLIGRGFGKINNRCSNTFSDTTFQKYLYIADNKTQQLAETRPPIVKFLLQEPI